MLCAKNRTYAGKKLQFAIGICEVEKDGTVLCDDQEFLKELVGLKGFEVFEMDEQTGQVAEAVAPASSAVQPALQNQLDEIAKLAGIEDLTQAPSLTDDRQEEAVPAPQSKKPAKKGN